MTSFVLSNNYLLLFKAYYFREFSNCYHQEMWAGGKGRLPQVVCCRARDEAVGWHLERREW